MRIIERSNAFKRDYKKVSKGIHKKVIVTELPKVLYNLANDLPLATEYKNHPLKEAWSKNNYWECHISPDLLLIYGEDKSNALLLARLGSHSELFG